ncbi:hypothetical protein [Kineococcus xinjiangensis]|nr:hypothetical protein [Kineococcus xinjiangensis]
MTMQDAPPRDVKPLMVVLLLFALVIFAPLLLGLLHDGTSDVELKENAKERAEEILPELMKKMQACAATNGSAQQGQAPMSQCMADASALPRALDVEGDVFMGDVTARADGATEIEFAVTGYDSTDGGFLGKSGVGYGMSICVKLTARPGSSKVIAHNIDCPFEGGSPDLIVRISEPHEIS